MAPTVQSLVSSLTQLLVNGGVDQEMVAQLTPDEPWEARGTVQLKGKGSMETYLLSRNS